MQNISSLSSKRTGKSQIWFTFAGVISQSCVSLINGEEQEEKKFPNTVIVSSATATKTESTMTDSMQALIFSSKALVLRKFGSTNHTLNSIDTRNDTTCFLFYSLNPPQKKCFCALSNADRICSSVQLYPTDFSSTPSATASWSQFPILSWSTPFLLIGFIVPSWKTIFRSSLFPFTCYWWTPYYSPFGIINTMRNGAY